MSDQEIKLNGRFSVGGDGSTWVLRRAGEEGKPPSPIAFCGTKAALLSNIAEHKVVCTAEAQEKLYALPSHYTAICSDPTCPTMATYKASRKVRKGSGDGDK